MIGHERRIAFNDGDALDGHSELFGCHLAHGDAQAGAHVDLAGVNRDRAIRMKCEEAVDLMRIERLAEIGSWGTLRENKPGQGRAEAEANHHRAAGQKETAPGNPTTLR